MAVEGQQPGVVELQPGQVAQHDPNNGQVVKFTGPDGKSYEITAGEILAGQKSQMLEADYTRKLQGVAQLRRQAEQLIAQHGQLPVAAAPGAVPQGLPPAQGAGRFQPGLPQPQVGVPALGGGSAAPQAYAPPPPSWPGQQPAGTPNGLPPAAQYPPQLSQEEVERLGPEAAQRIAYMEQALNGTNQQLARVSGLLEQQVVRTQEAEEVRALSTMPGFNLPAAEAELAGLDLVDQQRYAGYDRATQLRLVHAERVAPRQTQQPNPQQGQVQQPGQVQPNPQLQIAQQPNPQQQQLPPQQGAVPPQAQLPAPPFAEQGVAVPQSPGLQVSEFTQGSSRDDLIRGVQALDALAKAQGGWGSDQRPAPPIG